jgi:hypothetical protein
MHWKQIDACHHLEKLACRMGHAADARRRHVDLARIGLRIGNKFGNCLRRKRWNNDHNTGLSDDAPHSRDVAEETEIRIVVKRGIDRLRCADQEQHIGVSRSMRDSVDSMNAACTRPVLDDKGLSHSPGQPLTHDARGDVERAASRIADDDAHWPPRIGLCSCNP